VTFKLLFELFHDLVKGLQLCDYIIKKKDHFQFLDNTIFYSYWQNSSSFALALLKNYFPESKMICRAHRGDLYFYSQKNNYLSFRKYISEHMDKIFFISNDGKKYQEKLLQKKYSNFEISLLGTPNHSDHNTSKKKLQENVIVSCSNLISVKRVHLIIEALAAIEQHPIHWIHFGGGLLFNELNDYAKKMLADVNNISFNLKGHTPVQEILEFYSKNNVDLFINVSESEGIPVSIMEAMSFGIPVIATNVGGSSEIVDNYNGFLIERDFSIRELAKVIDNYLSASKGFISEKRKNTREKWSQNFNSDKNYIAFTNQLDRLK
jgi:glycosyltransferase involved in cell wall biosynthesis